MSPNRPRIRPNVSQRLIMLTAGWLLLYHPCQGQEATAPSDLLPDTLVPSRFWPVIGLGSGAYAGAFSVLNAAWYKDYSRTSFHSFDDSREWLGMDKAGHVFSTYFQSEWAYSVFRWTGVRKNAATWAGMGASLLVMSGIEVLDGFSTRWGFSWYDMAANVTGAGLWGLQQAVWDEQRIRVKVSSHRARYSADPVHGSTGGSSSLRERADDLFGSGPVERFLKDYNAQTIWVSVNPASFLRTKGKFPSWLNLAMGMSADNLFGGFENRWTIDADEFTADPTRYPRRREWILAPDIDLSRIPTRNRTLKVILGALNIFKIPAPALVFGGKRGLGWSWLYF